jgi:hypothetical protein
MKKISLGLVAALALAATAQAQTFESNKFYGGAELSSSKLDNETGSTANALVNAYGGSVTVTQDSRVRMGRFFGGYKLNDNVGFELGYLQSSNFGINAVGRSGGGTNYTIGASAKFSGLDYSVLLRPNVDTGLNNLYVRLGLHNYKADVTGSASAGGHTFSATESYSGTGSIYGVGYDADIGNEFKVRFAINKVKKVGGESDMGGTAYGVSLIKNF